MVAMNFTFPPAEYLIPAGLKLSTIRRRNQDKEEQIKRIKKIECYWKQRTSECRFLASCDVRECHAIDIPIIEFIHTARPELIYSEGFGHDRIAMEDFFKAHYDVELLRTPGAFYIVIWWPPEFQHNIEHLEVVC